jgi:hypothetical protein
VDRPDDLAGTAGPWPALPSDQWADTLETLHLFTQVVGKVRMGHAPWLNHSWSVPLYVSARGLSTSLVPHGAEGFELAFDLVDHDLDLVTTTGRHRRIPLAGQTVAAFHAAVLGALDDVGMPTEISPMPCEIPDAIAFAEDTVHDTYVPEHAHGVWRALLQANRVMARFRAGYLGKASPVHFFWGSFDLATTRFSGRTAPAHPGGLPHFPDEVAREAYSHEVTSCGLWFGNREAPMPVFYAYAYPTPDGFSDATVAPPDAVWSAEMGEFVLPYEVVRTSPDPDAMLEAFFASTHAVAADLAGWDRPALECADDHGPDWWADRFG